MWLILRTLSFSAATMSLLLRGPGCPTDKVTVCHKKATIAVARSAVDAHLKHGDYEGPCDPADPCPLISPPADALNVRSKEFGAVGDGIHDDTAAIQKAVDLAGPGGRVFIPSGVYRISAASQEPHAGINLRSNLDVYLAPDAILRMAPNDFGNYAIFFIHEKSDVNIYGGILIGDRETHQGEFGEWGMGINIRSSVRVKVWNVTAKELWGDGFYIGRGIPSRDIELCGVEGSHNRRQGLTITNADGVRLIKSAFYNNGDPLGGNGAVLETNSAFDMIRNVLVSESTFTDNFSDGVIINAQGLCCSQIVRSRTWENRNSGIRVLNTRHPSLEAVQFTIAQNAVRNNAEHGIWVAGSNDIAIVENAVENNGKHGIGLMESESIWVVQNTVKNHGEEDLFDSWGNCSKNKWDANVFQTSSPPCIK